MNGYPTTPSYGEGEILAAIIEASPVAIYSIDQNGIVTSWNKASEKIFGWKADEVLGKPLPIVPTRWEEQFEDLFAMLKNGQKFTELELNRLRKDGTEIDISLSTAPIHGPTGEMVGVLGIASEITSRKRAEEALRESEKRYRSLFQESRAVMLLVDPAQEIIVDANRAAHAYYGYEPHVFRGMPISRIETLSILSQRRDLNGTSSNFMEHFFTRHRLADDSIREVEVHGTPLDMDGQHFLCCIIHDITEKVQLESHLRQSQKMEAVATLAGGIAHDFNNILSAMLGFVDLIRMETSPESSIRPFVEQIRLAAKRAKDLIGQIFFITRDTEQEFHPIQIQSVIKEALRLLRGALPATIEIRQDISPTCGSILGDPIQIHQVLMNLCTNAYQAMLAGGVLEVTLEEQELPPDGRGVQLVGQTVTPGPVVNPTGRFACLTVRDTGQGMDTATRSRIFDPYFTTKEPREGTGLGLAIVHGIVANHNGFILVNSTPGQGSAFQVFFPLCESPEATPEDEFYSVLARGHNEHILYVDDEEAITKMRSILLGRIGYRVTTCQSGAEALALLCTSPWGFDVVITDLTMPGMTGIALGREIQNIRQGLPVILCTGQYTAGNTQDLYEAGIYRLLQKPVEDELLATTIREVLQEAAGNRANKNLP